MGERHGELSTSKCPQRPPELHGDAAGRSPKQSPPLGQRHSGVPPEEHSDHHASILHLRTQQGSELPLSPPRVRSTCRAARPHHGLAAPLLYRTILVRGGQRGDATPGMGTQSTEPRKAAPGSEVSQRGASPPPFPPLPVVSRSSDKSLPPQSTVCGKEPPPTASHRSPAGVCGAPGGAEPSDAPSSAKREAGAAPPRFAPVCAPSIPSVALSRSPRSARVQLSAPNPAIGTARRGGARSAPGTRHRNRTPSRAAAPRDAHGAARGMGGMGGSFCLFFFSSPFFFPSCPPLPAEPHAGWVRGWVSGGGRVRGGSHRPQPAGSRNTSSCLSCPVPRSRGGEVVVCGGGGLGSHSPAPSVFSEPRLQVTCRVSSFTWKVFLSGRCDFLE